jgi:hypothetical protein
MDLAGVKVIEPDVEWITTKRDEILQKFEAARAAS